MLDNNEPFLVEPVTNSTDEVIVWATIVWAVNVPLTVKLSADDAVAANEDETAFDAMPSNEPVNEPVNDPVLNDPLSAVKLELMLFILLSNDELSITWLPENTANDELLVVILDAKDELSLI